MIFSLFLVLNVEILHSLENEIDVRYDLKELWFQSQGLVTKTRHYLCYGWYQNIHQLWKVFDENWQYLCPISINFINFGYFHVPIQALPYRHEYLLNTRCCKDIIQCSYLDFNQLRIDFLLLYFKVNDFFNWELFCRLCLNILPKRYLRVFYLICDLWHLLFYNVWEEIRLFD